MGEKTKTPKAIQTRPNTSRPPPSKISCKFENEIKMKLEWNSNEIDTDAAAAGAAAASSAAAHGFTTVFTVVSRDAAAEAVAEEAAAAASAAAASVLISF